MLTGGRLFRLPRPRAGAWGLAKGRL